MHYSNHLGFSLRCLHNELVPKDLRPRCKVKTERCREAAHRFSRLQLQERIHLNHSTRDRIKASIDDLTADIKKTLSTEDFAEVESLQKLRCDKIMSQVRERHVKKFNDLLRQNDKAADDQNKVVDKDRWIINLSNRDLSSNEKSLLSRGLNFCLAPTIIPKKDIIAEVEGKIDYLERTGSITNSNGAYTRAEISTILTSASVPKDNISKKERQALKKLKNDKSIMI